MPDLTVLTLSSQSPGADAPILSVDEYPAYSQLLSLGSWPCKSDCLLRASLNMAPLCSSLLCLLVCALPLIGCSRAR